MKELILIGVLILSTSLKAECNKNADVLGAKYLIKQTSTEKHDHSHKNHFNLWRLSNRMGVERSEHKLLETWFKMPNGRIRPTQYFDAYQRGIEYEAELLNKEESKKAWLSKWQLISPELFKSMKKLKTSGKGCDRLEVYQLKNDNTDITIQWLPELKLVKSLIDNNSEHKTIWTLESVVEDKKVIEQVFSSRESYQTTDYADIGDMENDPFLNKMINIGFIKHDHNH